MSGERRRYPRSAVRLEAIQRVANRAFPRVVSNISSGGFFLEGAAAALGELLVVEFPEEAGPLRVTGEVAYVSERGVGVRITRADWRRLSRLLRPRVT